MIHTINNLVFGKGSYGEPMIIVIDTRNISSGSSNANQYFLPFGATVDTDIDYSVDFGDNTGILTVRSKTDPNGMHTYATAGIYQISISPTLKTLQRSIRLNFANTERLKLLKILRWGSYQFFSGYVANTTNLRLDEVTDIPKFLPSLPAFVSMFNGTTFPTINRLSEWQFTSANNIAPLVYNNPNFNQSFTINAPIATTIVGVWLCISFNSEIVINAPNLEDISQFFRGCTAFNKDISTWFDWSKIKNMTNFMTGKTSANYNPAFYSNMLIAMNNAGMSNVVIGMGAIKFTSAGSAPRAALISRGCTFTDGGLI